MRLDLAELLAKKLMLEHGLLDLGWRFKWEDSNIRSGSKTYTRLGTCNFDKKWIVLSSILTELNAITLIREVILHEIAHALVGYEQGHNEVWKAKAIEIGASGKVSYGREVILPNSGYEAVCEKGHVHRLFEKPKQATCCADCFTEFNPNAILKWNKI